ncbi:hypothetical protein CC80DRAFT_302041 [Byssothecium circinans]|uniref:Uncharacterized protein n=1 Tax=Byssothecium circinans TaxID=147558 RepID=A0A6A5U3R9_9PLEO|nr:hypothetical protein CC80DRAFT_302041 [Byssothecium circinans]
MPHSRFPASGDATATNLTCLQTLFQLSCSCFSFVLQKISTIYRFRRSQDTVNPWCVRSQFDLFSGNLRSDAFFATVKHRITTWLKHHSQHIKYISKRSRLPWEPQAPEKRTT